MKKVINVAIMVVLLAGLMVVPAMAEGPEMSIGADLVSNYVWRGTKFGTGPAVQPTVEFDYSGLAVGVWGSFGLTDNEAPEADLYFSYGFDNGLSIGMTDYYYPGSDYFEYSDKISSHAFEVNAGYEVGNLSLSGNYILNDSSEGAGSQGSDTYFEVGYSFGIASAFVGAGDGWHTTDHDFAVCNVGISAEKEIKVSETLTIPMTGSVIVNPEAKQMYVVVGMSF